MNYEFSRAIAICVVISYFIGAFPTGYIIVKMLKGIDIRTVGSGAIGATNVRRVLGRNWAIFVTIVDMLKGAFALLITAHIDPAGGSPEMLVSLSAFAAVMGHNFPVWLGFRGGKGVATTYGTMFFVWPYPSFAIVLMCGAIWYGLMAVTRYVSLASMISLLALPAFFWMLDAPTSFTLLALALALLSLLRHHANIARLLKGEENSIDAGRHPIVVTSTSVSSSTSNSSAADAPSNPSDELHQDQDK